MFDVQLLHDAAELLELCRRADIKLATAESCTGGLIIGCLTEIAGSSDVVDRGFVTYSDEAKTELVGVPAMLIALHGAVSEQVARAMAEGALSRSMADVTVAVTGIAGPGGGSADKPVGLVHFACAGRGRPTVARREVFPGNRAAIRDATVQTALALVRGLVSGG
jgi:nicotinamide-nucleotide amidase